MSYKSNPSLLRNINFPVTHKFKKTKDYLDFYFLKNYVFSYFNIVSFLIINTYTLNKKKKHFIYFSLIKERFSKFKRANIGFYLNPLKIKGFKTFYKSFKNKGTNSTKPEVFNYIKTHFAKAPNLNLLIPDKLKESIIKKKTLEFKNQKTKIIKKLKIQKYLPKKWFIKSRHYKAKMYRRSLRKLKRRLTLGGTLKKKKYKLKIPINADKSLNDSLNELKEEVFNSSKDASLQAWKRNTNPNKKKFMFPYDKESFWAKIKQELLDLETTKKPKLRGTSLHLLNKKLISNINSYQKQIKMKKETKNSSKIIKQYVRKKPITKK